MALHHVAYATKDLQATHRFYEELMGYRLVHAELSERPASGDVPKGWLKHVFYDIGDGECIAFFQVHNMGEQPDYNTDVSASVGLPVWVNHIAVRATSEAQQVVRERMAAVGVQPLMDIDHGWCHSIYYVDPNGIMVEQCADTPGFEPDPEAALKLLHAPAPSDPAPTDPVPAGHRPT